MPAFLDPKKPISTCISTTCEQCEIADTLHCHFSARDLARFLLNWLPPFFLGGAGIAHVGWLWLALWAITAFGFFGLLEIRALCSHCPHYAEPLPTLRCWANYGSPKLWKYRPGPMSQADRIEFAGGFAVVLGYQGQS